MGLLLVVGAGCSDKRADTTAHVRPAAGPLAPAAADPVPGGFVPRAVPLALLPDSLRQPGQLLEAWRWLDANGENLLVVFRAVPAAPPQPVAQVPASGPYDFREPQPAPASGRTAQLSARQYVRSAVRPGPSGGYSELWRLRDFVVDCPLSVTLGPQPGSTAITDLDHNGRTETTLMYTLGCGSGSTTLKLIMRAGDAKYALRGTTVRTDDPDHARRRPPANPCCLDTLSPDHRQPGLTAGYYQTEAGFRGAPPAFLRFARQHWRKFSVEKAAPLEKPTNR